MGAFICPKCGNWMFSFNFMIHDCVPAPTLAPALEWEDDPPQDAPSSAAGTSMADGEG